MSGIDLRRRNFFKTSMGAAAVAIAPGILLFDTAYGKPPAGAGDGKVRWGMLIGVISSLKRPASMAATAFCWDAAAKASCSSRDSWYLSARFSAVMPMW